MIAVPPWIEITTILPCPGGCYYCPQAKLAQAYQGEPALTLERFRAVLANVPQEVMIDFAGFAEPFANPECADMILCAYETGHRVGVNSTLVGLTDEDAVRIAHVPFEFFIYHDARNEKREYPFLTERVRIDTPESRAGNLYAVDRIDGPGLCGRDDDRRINVMLPNADVVLCCQDYGLKYPLGNLLDMPYDWLHRTGERELCHYCRYWRTNED